MLHVAALLRQYLIFEVETGHAGPLVLLHGPDHVDRVAVASVGVGHDRSIDCGADASGVVDHLGEPEEAHVGPAEQ